MSADSEVGVWYCAKCVQPDGVHAEGCSRAPALTSVAKVVDRGPTVDLTMIDIEDGGELDPPSLVCRVPGCRYDSAFDQSIPYDERRRWYSRSVGYWAALAEKHLDTHREPA